MYRPFTSMVTVCISILEAPGEAARPPSSCVLDGTSGQQLPRALRPSGRTAWPTILSIDSRTRQRCQDKEANVATRPTGRSAAPLRVVGEGAKSYIRAVRAAILLSCSLRISADYSLLNPSRDPYRAAPVVTSRCGLAFRRKTLAQLALHLVDAVNSPGLGVSDATSNGGIESGQAQIALQPTP